jgi:hypothetical protein
MPTLSRAILAASLFVATAAAGCGSSSTSSPSAGVRDQTPTAASTASSSPAAGALAADAHSAATGDIPDNQVFLVFTNRTAGYSMKYPEGWTQSGSGTTITFKDKNNVVRVVVTREPAPTAASVSAQLNRLRATTSALTFTAPRPVALASGPAIKAVYRTQSAPNAVTGKRVELIVDRYALARGARVATVDLGTPKGVDNVDAYRMMINSFRWR